MLFEYGNYDEAVKIINNILSHKYNKVRYDLLTYSYLLAIFIHIELNNFQLAKSYIKTISVNFPTIKRRNGEKLSWKFYRTIIWKNKEKKYIWKSFLERINLLKTIPSEQAFYK